MEEHGVCVCVCNARIIYAEVYLGNEGLALVMGTWQNEKWPKGVGKTSWVGMMSPSLPPSPPPCFPLPSLP